LPVKSVRKSVMFFRDINANRDPLGSSPGLTVIRNGDERRAEAANTD
jgi:hypothetical protein